jgi:hypothetical protein
MNSDFVVPGLLPIGELTLLVASPRTGKTSLCLSLANAVTTGGHFLGRRCTAGSVIYRDLDYGLTSFDLPALAKAIEQVKPALVVLDSLIGSALDATRMQSLRRLSQDCAIVVVLQSRKGSADQSISPLDLVPGSLAIQAVAHGCWILLPDRLIIENRFGREVIDDPRTLNWTAPHVDAA